MDCKDMINTINENNKKISDIIINDLKSNDTVELKNTIVKLKNEIAQMKGKIKENLTDACCFPYMGIVIM